MSKIKIYHLPLTRKEIEMLKWVIGKGVHLNDVTLTNYWGVTGVQIYKSLRGKLIDWKFP